LLERANVLNLCHSTSFLLSKHLIHALQYIFVFGLFPVAEPQTISYDLIRRIEAMDKSKFSKLERFYIDFFLFSFYAGGIFSDLDPAVRLFEIRQDDFRIAMLYVLLSEVRR
jgi:hypothetical protein